MRADIAFLWVFLRVFPVWPCRERAWPSYVLKLLMIKCGFLWAGAQGLTQTLKGSSARRLTWRRQSCTAPWVKFARLGCNSFLLSPEAGQQAGEKARGWRSKPLTMLWVRGMSKSTSATCPACHHRTLLTLPTTKSMCCYGQEVPVFTGEVPPTPWDPELGQKWEDAASKFSFMAFPGDKTACVMQGRSDEPVSLQGCHFMQLPALSPTPTPSQKRPDV